MTADLIIGGLDDLQKSMNCWGFVQWRGRRGAWRGRCSSCCMTRRTLRSSAACLSAGRPGCNPDLGIQVLDL